MIEKVSLAEKFASFEEIWAPKIVGELNGQYVKVVKFQGEFVWHSQNKTDEAFNVLNGKMQIQLRDGLINLRSRGNNYHPKWLRT